MTPIKIWICLPCYFVNIPLLILYYVFSVIIKKHYYKHVAGNLDGFGRYCLFQAIIVLSLIIPDMLLHFPSFNLSFMHPFFTDVMSIIMLIFVSSFCEIMCLKNKIKRVRMVFVTNFCLFILLFFIGGIIMTEEIREFFFPMRVLYRYIFEYKFLIG